MPRPVALELLRRRELPAGRADRAVTLALHFVGAALCFVFLVSIASWVAVGIAALLATALFALASRPSPRWAGRSARAVEIVVHAFWIYAAVAFGSVLSWSVSWALIAAAASSLAAAAWTARPSWSRARVTLALPLGIWIAACLSGWLREEAFVRCDDLARVVAQSSVEVAVATSTSGCHPGQAIAIARYPRKIWESPDGARYVFTTQTNAPGVSPHAPTPGRMTGGVCEARADGSGEPRCFGLGKAHGIVDAEQLDRLFVTAWGFRFPDGLDGVIYELTRTAPLELVREVRISSAADGFYEPTTDTLGTLADPGATMVPLRASTLTPLPPVPAPIIPNDIHYDAGRGEGVVCFAAGPLRTLPGGAYMAVAFRGAPPSFRPLGSASTYPSAWLSLSWGCDWDPAARRVYATIPDLGLLVTLDYDTGRVMRRDFVGFGFRSLAYDAPRRRVYMTDFLGGDVIAVDVDTGHEAARWFAGRFLRDARISRDGSSLLVSANVGLVRIRLP